MNQNNIPCPEIMLITNIVLKPKSSEGLFLFGPDIYTFPGSGNYIANTEICPMDVSVLANGKGDIKLTLLDDNRAPLYSMILKCSQYDIRGIHDKQFVPYNIQGLYTNYGNEMIYRDVIGINSTNLYLMKDYVSFEEAAYFYRNVTCSYQNLWKGSDKRSGIIPQIILNTRDILEELIEGDPMDAKNAVTQASQQVWAMSQNLIKSRMVGLVHLAESTRFRDDQMFVKQISYST